MVATSSRPMGTQWCSYSSSFATGIGLLLCMTWAAAASAQQLGLTIVQQQVQQQQLQQQAQGVGCKGLGRKSVDWWVMLKHPAGYQYSYIDSRILSSSVSSSCATGSCWRHRLTMMNPNPVAHTLAILAAAAPPAAADVAAGQKGAAPSAVAQAAVPAAALAYVVYNDDEPAGIEHFEHAHAKGVAAFSSDSNGNSTGFWLMHSAPRFPKAPTEPGFADLAHAQSVFGQHFACFSLAGDDAIATVAATLQVVGPHIYSSQLPAILAAAFPAWLLLIAGFNDTQQHTVSSSMQTAAGGQLHSFAKTRYVKASLTDAIVGPGLGSNMLWETWRRSHDALPSWCPGDGQYSSINVQQIAFPGSIYTWHWSQDHSKWGISSNTTGNNQQVVCVGDINRAYWQWHRGGAYLCMRHEGLWQAFSSIVVAVEPCSTIVSSQ